MHNPKQYLIIIIDIGKINNLRCGTCGLNPGTSGSGVSICSACLAAQPAVAVAVFGTSLSDLFGIWETNKVKKIWCPENELQYKLKIW